VSGSSSSPFTTIDPSNSYKRAPEKIKGGIKKKKKRGGERERGNISE
jgi:hypothetical protein